MYYVFSRLFLWLCVAVSCFFCVLMPIQAYAQILNTHIQEYKTIQTLKDSTKKDSVKTSLKLPKPAFLDQSYLDIFTNGSFQASTQLIKVYVGEPAGYHVPLYICMSLSGSTVKQDTSRIGVFGSLINPIGGTVSASLSRNHRGFRKYVGKTSEITHAGFSYHTSIRLINGQNSKQENIPFVSFYSDVGIYFQTGAWLANENSDNLGVFYFQPKLFFCTQKQSKVTEIFGEKVPSTLYGASIEVGIHIANKLNFRVIYSKGLNEDLRDGYKEPQIRFSLDYGNMKK